MTKSADVSPVAPRWQVLDVREMARLAPDLFRVSACPPVVLPALVRAPATEWRARAAVPRKRVPKARHP